MKKYPWIVSDIALAIATIGSIILIIGVYYCAEVMYKGASQYITAIISSCSLFVVIYSILKAIREGVL